MCVVRFDDCKGRAAARLMVPGEKPVPLCMNCLVDRGDLPMPPSWGLVPLEFGGPHDLDTPVMRLPVLRSYLRMNLPGILDVEPILVGHTANLLMQHPAVGRVWQSRLTRSDGARFNYAIEVERLVGDVWVTVLEIAPSPVTEEAW